MLGLSKIIANMEYERIDLEKKIEKLEKDLKKSENIRRDLVDVNKILTIAVQQALSALRGHGAAFNAVQLLEKAEDEVKKISIREY